jgi:hypothetical protein
MKMKKKTQFQIYDINRILLIFLLVSPLNLIAQNKFNYFKTGNYGLVSIVVKNDSIFGAFRYYINWRDDLKEFESKNNFFFYGSVNNNVANLKVTNPIEKENFGDISSGKISIYKDSVFYSQNSLEGMFQPDFFPDNFNKKKKGYRGKLIQKKEWINIRFVKKTRAFFFDSLGQKPRKAYLLKGDLVFVLKTVNKVHLVEFYKNDSNILVTKGWIKEEDLYNENPESW